MKELTDWETAQQQMQVLEAKLDPQFAILLNKIQKMVNAQAYPLGVFGGLFDVVEKMNEDVKNGRDIEQLTQEAASGTYIQPDWEVNTVYQTNGNIFKFVFNDFHSELKKRAIIPVPIALFVLNDIEVDSMLSGSIFGQFHTDLLENFKQLETVLADHGILDWKSTYAPSPKDWKPFKDSPDTIETVCRNALRYFSQPDAEFAPDFIDVRTLSEVENRQLLRNLRYKGCITVVDGISMRHPLMQKYFYQAALDMYQKTSVVTIIPPRSRSESFLELKVIIELTIRDMEFTKRRLDYYDEYGACKEIDEEMEFKKWFVDRVRKLYPETDGSDSVRPYMFNNLRSGS